MTEAVAKFSRLLGSQQASSQEEKMLIDLLYNNNISLQIGDKRLNNVAALTWNSNQCDNIFRILEKSLNPEKYPWQTLHKAVLLLHTITLYGSEIAIDACIQLFRSIDRLQTYNSALVKQGGLFATGGTDFGSPVRNAAKTLISILENDDSIRNARQNARNETESLVPMGEDFDAIASASAGRSNAAAHEFGQGMETSYLGAGFDLSQVPGMYENRPDRYFDDINDTRQHKTVGDHQFTREAMNTESLLDMVFADTSGDQVNGNTSLPDTTDYLPALARQKELEKQLAEQQQQLQKLQMLQQQQQQQQSQQPLGSYYGGPMTNSMMMQQGPPPNVFNNLYQQQIPQQLPNIMTNSTGSMQHVSHQFPQGNFPTQGNNTQMTTFPNQSQQPSNHPNFGPQYGQHMGMLNQQLQHPQSE